MIAQLMIGAALLMVALAFHATVLDRAATMARHILAPIEVRPGAMLRIAILCGTALLAFLSHVAQVWLWAFVYIQAGEFDRLEEALYFSTVSLTTLGFGDVTVSADWRLLSSFESAAGLFLFGMSTAFVFDMMRTVWQYHAPPEG